MSLLLVYLPFLLSGVGVYALLGAWRWGRKRRERWPSPVKAAAKWAFSLASLGTGGFLCAALLRPGVEVGVALFGLVLGFVVPGAVMLRSKKRPPESQTQAAFSDGATERTAQDSVAALVRRLKGSPVSSGRSLAGVPWPEGTELKHLLVAGADEDARLALLTELLQRVRERGDTAIVVSKGGRLLAANLHADTDFVLNPYDERCVPWAPTVEVRSAVDALAMSRSMVPDTVGGTDAKTAAVQGFLAAVLRRLAETNRLALADLLHFVQVASRSELQAFLQGTAGVFHLESERSFEEIRALACGVVAPYEHLPAYSEEQFSVTEMVQAEHSGCLFLAYREDQGELLKGLLACVLDVAARSILALPPNPTRRVWLVIDDFASLGRVPNLEALMAGAGNVGGCVVLGLSDIRRLDERHGQVAARAVLSHVASGAVFRCDDTETAEYCSARLGSAEAGAKRKTATLSTAPREKELPSSPVSATQLQALESARGLLKLPGNQAAHPIAVAGAGLLPKKAPAFQARDYSLHPLVPPVPGGAGRREEAPVSETPADEGQLHVAVAQPAPREVALQQKPSAVDLVGTTVPPTAGDAEATEPAMPETPEVAPVADPRVFLELPSSAAGQGRRMQGARSAPGANSRQAVEPVTDRARQPAARAAPVEPKRTDGNSTAGPCLELPSSKRRGTKGLSPARQRRPSAGLSLLNLLG